MTYQTGVICLIPNCFEFEIILIMSSNEISYSLIQEVLACNEMASQWSERTSGVEDAATTDLSTDGHAETAETSGDLIPSGKSLVPIAKHRIPETEAELTDLLNAVRQLIATAGVRLVAAPCGTWNFDGYAAKLRRPLTFQWMPSSQVKRY